MTYYGDTHIFTNQTNQANITIKAGKNENLIIENPTLTGIVNASIGTNKQVIYNNNNLLVGSSKMTFDGSVFYSQDSISTGSLDGSVSSDSVGYNQIYQGTGPQSVVTTQVSDLDDVGTDVSMARNTNRVAFASPKSPNLGGVSIWTKGVSTFEEYTEGVVSYKTALTSPNLKFSSFDEDAIILVVFAGDTAGTITTWDCGSETFVDISTQSFGLSAGKISEDRMLAYDYNSNFKCYELVGDDWVLKQTLLTNSLSTSYSLDYAITISGTKLAFSYGSATYVYNYDFVSWSLVSTIPFGAISLDYYAGVLAHVTTGDLRIYENFNLVATFNVANLLHTCTNGTYVFTITSTGVIRIYSKVSGVWTASVNTYNAGSDSKKMSCNSGYLAVGRPSVAPRGEGYIFQIQTYTNGPIIVNTLDLVNGSNQIEITAAAGTKFNNRVFIPNGTAALPSLAFSNSTDMGLYRIGTTTAGFSCGGLRQAELSSATASSTLAVNGTGDVFSFLFSKGAAVLAYGDGYFNGSANVEKVPLALRQTRAYSGGVTPVFQQFLNNSGTGCGSIYMPSNTTIALSTSSDRRLKDDIIPIENSLELVTALRPRSFVWKCMNSECEVCPTGDFCANCVPDVGFIADEFQVALKDAAPNCVQGQPNGQNYQSIDKTVVIPLLTAGVQELIKIIEDLTQRISVLERKNI